MERWTRFVLRHRWPVLGAWLVVFLVAGFASSRLADLLTNRFTLPAPDSQRAEQILAVATRHGLAGNALLDLACGTGNSFLPFERRGFRVTGCDGSAAMLAEAACKAPDVALVHADLRSLGVLGRFDLVTSFDDSLHYMPDRECLELKGVRTRGMSLNMMWERTMLSGSDLPNIASEAPPGVVRDGENRRRQVRCAARGE